MKSTEEPVKRENIIRNSWKNSLSVCYLANCPVKFTGRFGQSFALLAFLRSKDMRAGNKLKLVNYGLEIITMPFVFILIPAFKFNQI